MKPVDRILENLIRQGIVAKEDKEIYRYGIGQLCFQFINLTTTAVIGLISGMLLEALVFTATYIPLRIYAGGFHTKTQLRCYFFSTGLLVLALICIQMLSQSSCILLILMLLGACIIFAFAPVADSNKPLSKREQTVYRKRAHRLLVAFLLIAAGLYFMQLKTFTVCIGTAIFTLSIMLILGFIKNKRRQMVDEHLEGDG